MQSIQSIKPKGITFQSPHIMYYPLPPQQLSSQTQSLLLVLLVIYSSQHTSVTAYSLITPHHFLSTSSALTASSLAHLYVQFLSRCPIFQRRRGLLRTLPHMPALSCLLQKTTQERTAQMNNQIFKSVSLKCEYVWIYLLLEHEVKHDVKYFVM